MARREALTWQLGVQGRREAVRDVEAFGDAWQDLDRRVDSLGDTLDRSSAEWRGLERDIDRHTGGASRSIRGLGDDIGRAAREAGQDLDRLGRDFDDLEGSLSFGDIVGGSALGGMAADAFSAAAGFAADAFLDTIGQELSSDVAAARLGMFGPDEAAALGDTAGRLYADAWGESFEDVTAAIVAADEALGGLGIDALAGEQVPELIALAQVAEADINEVANAVGAFARATGVSVPEAMDLIAGAVTNGANRYGDLFDVLSEYSPQLDQLNLSAEDWIDTLIRGSDAQVYNLDVVADALKSLQERLAEGSDASRDALVMLGLDADAVIRQVNAGGTQARDAVNDVVDGLLALNDEARTAQSLALVGDPLVNLGLSAERLELLRQTTGELETFSGTLEQVIAVAYDNEATRWDAQVRQLKDNIGGLVQEVAQPVVEGWNLVFDAIANGVEESSRLGRALDAAGIGIDLSDFRQSVNVGGVHGKDPEGRASGGRVNPGVPYIVGERRPELFVPDIAGTILPDVPTPRNVAAPQVNINVSAIDVASFENWVGRPEIIRSLTDRIAEHTAHQNVVKGH
ncbi:phage tail tape measure protein [Euzebya pacifica]|uniref:phage tail tape measure protein n=1 Tax=Euzebya pacifica TaxID=1608957 RepID=UPI0030FAE75F